MSSFILSSHNITLPTYAIFTSHCYLLIWFVADEVKCIKLMFRGLEAYEYFCIIFLNAEFLAFHSFTGLQNYMIWFVLDKLFCLICSFTQFSQWNFIWQMHIHDSHAIKPADFVFSAYWPDLVIRFTLSLHTNRAHTVSLSLLIFSGLFPKLNHAASPHCIASLSSTREVAEEQMPCLKVTKGWG